jgi:hypothetical protein
MRRTTLNRYISVAAIAISSLFVFAGCVKLQRADETWESAGPIKVRIERKYSLGHEHYFFDALDAKTGRWKPVMSAWRDLTGTMPIESFRAVDSRIGYFFLVDQVAVTTDAGTTWTVFNASKYFNCGWDGCAPIKDLSISTVGVGVLEGWKRVDTQWVEFKLETKDFGKTWHANDGV